MSPAEYDHNVFLNCPFDDGYRELFQAIVFAIHDCGYTARCALEIDDGSQVRIEKIAALIASCRFGIHDVSRTELDAATGLPRFNMPFEMGMFLGAKRFGHGRQKMKSCLILDLERYRFQKFISDIAGQDIAAHHGEPERAIAAVRDWLSASSAKSIRIPGGAEIARRYRRFREQLPAACTRLRLSMQELTFTDYVVQVEEWLRADQASVPS